MIILIYPTLDFHALRPTLKSCLFPIHRLGEKNKQFYGVYCILKVLKMLKYALIEQHSGFSVEVGNGTHFSRIFRKVFPNDYEENASLYLYWHQLPIVLYQLINWPSVVCFSIPKEILDH